MASLDLRQGILGKRLAAHLLRRTSYYITPSRIADFANKTADQAVDELLTIPTLNEPLGPINFEDSTTYWLTTGDYSNGPSDSTDRKFSVLLWFYNELMNDPSIRHKMTIFYTGIFVSADDEDWRIFDNYRLFQTYCVGNIKDLAYKVTLDNRMLRYLNNNVNNKWSPNENYAREFFELFTILKGPQISLGNYTYYTEDDIGEAARVLTGFRDEDFTNKDPDTGLATGKAYHNWHDTGNKQFSAAFQNKVIMGAANDTEMYSELQEFVDMVFAQVETARAYVRKLYLYFVHDIITPEIEQDIIEPLALQLWNDGFELENTLKRLLKSKHFYDEDDSDHTNEIIGGKIKSPLELLFTSINLFDANGLGSINTNPSNYDLYANQVLRNILEVMGFPLFAPSVEGYPGFFKAPSFSKNWIDTSTLVPRFNLATALLIGKTIKNQGADSPFQVDLVNYIKNNFINQAYPDHLLTQLFEILLPEMPDADRRNYFKDKLIGGVSDVEWMHAWQKYLATGNTTAVDIVLTDLFETIVGSPEFQTM